MIFGKKNRATVTVERTEERRAAKHRVYVTATAATPEIAKKTALDTLAEAWAWIEPGQGAIDEALRSDTPRSLETDQKPSDAALPDPTLGGEP